VGRGRDIAEECNKTRNGKQNSEFLVDDDRAIGQDVIVQVEEKKTTSTSRHAA
jgi:hypothetical protein